MSPASAETDTDLSPESSREWTLEITPRHDWLHIPFRDIWEFRDLLVLLVRRDIVSVYKQTILGPIWYVLQPLLTMVMFVAVFGNIARISTDDLPQPLFYLSGIVIWNYFAETFARTSVTFTFNAEVFGKVYFPRLLIPLSFMISGIGKFLIQLGLLLLMYCWYLAAGSPVRPHLTGLLIPYLVLLMAGMGLGFGLLICSLTSKYRDLNFVVQFGVQILMYTTPIIYPMSLLSPRLYRVIWWNPITHVVEAFRYGLFSVGDFSVTGLVYSTLFTVGILLLGIFVFNDTEKTVMDTL